MTDKAQILTVVCSNKPRSYKGAASNDTVHLKVQGRFSTLCGRDASDWLVMESKAADVMESAYLCRRCAARASLTKDGDRS